MTHCRLLGIGAALALVGWLASAQSSSRAEKPKASASAAKTAAPAEESGELAALRQAAKEFVEAFNKGDAKAVAAHWTKDGEYVDEAGNTFTGRDAIEQEYAAFFSAHQGVTMQLEIDSLRLLSDHAAMEDGRVMLDPALPGAGTTKYTAVHVKVGDRWLMSSVRDRVAQGDAPPSLNDLDWLIGSWTAEEHGSKTESVCRWVAEKAFVERTYTVTHPDGATASGVQVIGYHPLTGAIQSWSFSSDGGIAVGTWMPTEFGWATEQEGTTGDGIPTTAVNILTRLDDNAYSWQSVSRTADGAELPDTNEVIVKRTTPAN